MANEAEVFARGVRMAETGSFEGAYQRVYGLVRGSNRLLGAYGFPSDEWQQMAEDVGMKGARWKDPKAQDLVAYRTFERLYDRYGDWRLVAVAWKAGMKVADAVANDPTLLDHKNLKPVKSYARSVMQGAGKNLKMTKPVNRDGTAIAPEAFPQKLEGMIPAGMEAGVGPPPDAAEDALRKMLIAMRDRQRNVAKAQQIASPAIPAAAPSEPAPEAPVETPVEAPVA